MRRALALVLCLLCLALVWILASTGAAGDGDGDIAMESPRELGAATGARVFSEVSPRVGHGSASSLDQPLRTTEAAGEAVANPDDCLSECGAACVKIDGETRCPPRCETDQDCAIGLCTFADAFDPDGRLVRRCLVSECSGIGTDDACGIGRICSVRSRFSGESIFMCTTAGSQTKGQPCSANVNYEPSGRCARGLRCTDHGCLPLRCTDDDDCGPGSSCATFVGADSKMCRPHCTTDQDCSGGRVCRQIPRALGFAALCIAPERLGCIDEGCGAGEACYVHEYQAAGFEASCVKTCDASRQQDDCEGEAFCGSDRTSRLPGLCYAPCGADYGCPEGQACVAVDTSAGEQLGCDRLVDPEEYLGTPARADAP